MNTNSTSSKKEKIKEIDKLDLTRFKLLSQKKWHKNPQNRRKYVHMSGKRLVSRTYF